VSAEFQPLGEEISWEGAIIKAGTARYRYEDGAEVDRDKIWHPGAVAILPVDETHVWLIRQPREVIGEPALLEIPAGKLDVPGEPALEAAKRELAEEIGMQASDWRELLDFYTTAGFCDERIWLFVAKGLSATDAVGHAEEDERIDIVPWRLDDLDAAISACSDAKTLIALLWLARTGAGAQGQDQA
jgi:8-oxo-dGTP pyrophosphatase MutT (NUDIX family)